MLFTPDCSAPMAQWPDPNKGCSGTGLNPSCIPTCCARWAASRTEHPMWYCKVQDGRSLSHVPFRAWKGPHLLLLCYLCRNRLRIEAMEIFPGKSVKPAPNCAEFPCLVLLRGQNTNLLPRALVFSWFQMDCCTFFMPYIRGH